MRTVTIKIIAMAIGAWAILVALAWTFQRKFIYFPTTTSVPPSSDYLEGAEEVTFGTEDGIRLAGWFVAASPGALRREAAPTRDADGAAGRGSFATVLVFNGNGGDRSYRAPLAEELAQGGYNVLLFDYRGYGGAPGSPSEKGLGLDARAARAYLDGRGDVDPARVAYYGESLGCALALRLAIERPPAAIILRSPFTSMADVGRSHYPFLPVRSLLKDRYASIDIIGRLSAPLLVIAGDRDSIVPAEQSRRLFEAAPEPRRFVLIKGADHNDLELLAGEQLMGEVLSFLEITLTGSKGRFGAGGTRRFLCP